MKVKIKLKDEKAGSALNGYMFFLNNKVYAGEEVEIECEEKDLELKQFCEWFEVVGGAKVESSDDSIFEDPEVSSEE